VKLKLPVLQGEVLGVWSSIKCAHELLKLLLHTVLYLLAEIKRCSFFRSFTQQESSRMLGARSTTARCLQTMAVCSGDDNTLLTQSMGISSLLYFG